MDETNNTDERPRFVSGGKPGPGRPKGSRNLLAESFLDDLRDTWITHGKTALEAAAVTRPAEFVRVVAGLLPSHAKLDVNVDVFHDATNVLTAFRLASDLLGADPRDALQRLREHAPHLIEHDDG
jgi:hypothetical protein